MRRIRTHSNGLAKLPAPKYEYRLRFADGTEERARLGGLQAAMVKQLASLLRITDIRQQP